MKLGDLTKGKNPLSGGEISIFNIAGIWQLILGSVVLMVVYKLATGFANTVFGKLPKSVTNAGQPQTDANSGITLL